MEADRSLTELCEDDPCPEDDCGGMLKARVIGDRRYLICTKDEQHGWEQGRVVRQRRRKVMTHTDTAPRR